jgi:glycosyltransferase involved in cell wall biosynthesis
MKNYLVDLHRLRHNPYNGLYIFCYELAAHLVKLDLQNEALYFYLPRDKFGLFGTRPHYVEHKRNHKFFQFGTGKYDVWHLTSGISQYKPFNRQTRVVYTIHYVNFLVEDPDNKKRNARSIRLMQKNCDRADHIVAVSDYAMQFAARHLDFGNKPRSVIYNGYSVKEFKDAKGPAYKPLHKFLFSIGLVQPRKNLHVLPALLKGNDYELVIAGLNHFEYASRVMEEAKLLGVENRVKLIGPVSEEEKTWYYQHCEAFLFPSVAEGFGIPPLEAMHFGKPVFLSTYMSLPEIGGTAAFYFHDFSPDAMREAFSNGMADHEKNEHAEIVRKHAATFSWDRAAKEYMDIYRELS